MGTWSRGQHVASAETQPAAASSKVDCVQALSHTGFRAEILITYIPFSIIKHKAVQ